MAERGAGPEAETWHGRVKEDDPDMWAPPVSGRSGDGAASGWRRRRAAELGRVRFPGPREEKEKREEGLGRAENEREGK